LKFLRYNPCRLKSSKHENLMMKKLTLFILLMVLLSACSDSPTPAMPVAQTGEELAEIPAQAEDTQDTVSPTEADGEAEDAAVATSTPRPPLAPDAWMEMPVIPEVSDNARAIYARGQELGNDPQVFSKIGDCQNVSSLFLGVFENPDDFSLGAEYAYLQTTIDYFNGSFSRESLAVKGGFNVAAILSPLRADKSACEPNESPVACELRENNPSFVFISLEEWWADKPAEEYEAYLQKIVEQAIDEGVVPILATKADDLEGDNGINQAIARIAYEYDIPLWNFWAAVQPLPNHGLSEDGFHLSYARNFFDDPARMESAWPWRNLTALQSLDAVWHGVTE
jgi:hypothetical protein